MALQKNTQIYFFDTIFEKHLIKF